jgi:hypothetical protein
VDAVIVLTQEAAVDIEVLDATDVAADTPINWVATDVTTSSRLLGT